MKDKLLAVWQVSNFRGTGLNPHNSYEEVNMLPALKQMFTVQVLDWAGISDASIIHAVEQFQPKYLFVQWYRTGIQPQTIQYIHKTFGTETILWSGDDEQEWDIKEPWAKKRIVPYFQHHITTFAGGVSRYKKLGITPIVTTFAANEKVYKPRKIKKTMDVSFIGTGYEDRVQWIRDLRPLLPELRVAGGMWAQFPFLSLDAYPKAFNQTKVNLNFGWNRGHLQIKGRDFEIPMSGGFLLTTHNPALAKYFVLGKEIETYKSNRELVAKVKYYLKNEKKREAIARAGHRRAIKDHTYSKRFKDLFKQL